MSESVEKKQPKALERVGGYMGILGAIAIAIVTADAYLDFIDLPGDNPFDGEDGANFKNILRDLRDMPEGDFEPEDLTTKQKITYFGMMGTFATTVFGTRPFRNFSVGGSLTLGTLAAYEALLLMPLGFSTGGLFFAGAASSMYGISLVKMVEEPKNPIQQAKDGINKVKDKVRRK